jgi:dTDP-4-dehydrorhamnose 3,5-epimerase
VVDLRPSPTIDGVVVAVPELHEDQRGRMLETWRAEWFPGRPPMVQANRADRVAGCVVGLHVHRRQADYWYVVAGRARVVLHDLRPRSATAGATVVLDLGGDEGAELRHAGVYIPPGVGHGFAALTDVTLAYLVDRTYDPSDELGVAWDDPAVGADWGLAAPMLSARDRTQPSVAAYLAAAGDGAGDDPEGPGAGGARG